MLSITRSDLEDCLRHVHRHHKTLDFANLISLALQLKQSALAIGDETSANEIWALENIAEAQNHYLVALDLCRKRNFFEAWCTLERAELSCASVLHNYPTLGQRYWLNFIRRQVGWLQKLFPYQVFTSTGMLVDERRCSICGSVLTLRHRCTHLKGSVYQGEQCCHIISKCRLLEVSMVTDPVHKYAVAFPSDRTGSGRDPYNYAAVDYVVRGLRTPFVSFRFEETSRPLSVKERSSLLPMQLCPCGSKNAYKCCCASLAVVIVPHQRVFFEQDPPASHPTFVPPLFVESMSKMPGSQSNVKSKRQQDLSV